MEKEQKRKDAYLLNSVNHSLQILELLMARDGLRLKDISGLLGLDQTSTFKMLYTLSYRGFVVKDAHSRYHIGNKLAACRQLSEVRHHIAEIAGPYILNLWAKTKKTVLLGALGQDERLVILSIRTEKDQESIVGRIGAGMALHTSGLGKVLLAFQIQDSADTFFENYKLKKMTESTITDKKIFRECLKNCREQKWGAAFEENHVGHCDIAVPVFDYTDSCVAALCIVCDRESMDAYMPLYLKYLRSAAEKISGQLGYTSGQKGIWN